MIDLARFDAAIFDMDGLLIDSEPHWQDAEIAVYEPFGVPVDRDLCRATAGRRIDEVLTLWHERFDWNGPPVDEMVERVLEDVTRRILEHGEPLPGVRETFDALHEAGLKIAIASSSPPALIDAVVEKLDLARYLDVTHSGVHEERGKPDPAVFLTAAERLAVDPARCLVFEDADIDADDYVVWSNEHGAWWRPHRLGYTPHLLEAGEDHQDRVIAAVRALASGRGTSTTRSIVGVRAGSQ